MVKYVKLDNEKLAVPFF